MEEGQECASCSDSDGLSAVDDEGVADGEAAEIEAQPQHRGGDLLGLAAGLLVDDPLTRFGGTGERSGPSWASRLSIGRRRLAVAGHEVVDTVFDLWD